MPEPRLTIADWWSIIKEACKNQGQTPAGFASWALASLVYMTGFIAVFALDAFLMYSVSWKVLAISLAFQAWAVLGAWSQHVTPGKPGKLPFVDPNKSPVNFPVVFTTTTAYLLWDVNVYDVVFSWLRAVAAL